MSALKDLRAQLAEHDDAFAAIQRRVDDLRATARAQRYHPGAATDDEHPSSPSVDRRFDVYSSCDSLARRRLDDAFDFFAQNSGRVTKATLAQAAAEELGLKLSPAQVDGFFRRDPTIYSAAELLKLPAALADSDQDALSAAEFARLWVYSHAASAVLLRAAYTRREVQLAGRRRAERDPAAAYAPVKKLCATASVGAVEGATFPSSIKLLVQPSSSVSFDDVLEDLKEATKNPDADCEPIPVEELAAVTSMRFPLRADASEDAAQECVELFRAAAEEFNAQGDFPVQAHIGLDRTSGGRGTGEIVIALLVRSSLVDGEWPFVKFLATLELLQDLGSTVGAQGEFFEKFMLGIDFGVDASKVLTLAPDAAPVMALVEAMRVAVVAHVNEALVDAVHQYLIAHQDGMPSLFPATLVPRLLNTLTVETHFGNGAAAADKALDIFEDALLALKLSNSTNRDETAVAKLRAEAAEARNTLRAHLTRSKKTLALGGRVRSLLAVPQVRKVLGLRERKTRVISVSGSDDDYTSWFVHCLETPSARQLSSIDQQAIASKKFLSGPFTMPIAAHRAVNVFKHATAARAVATEGPVIALFDVTSTATFLRDVTRFEKLEKPFAAIAVTYRVSTGYASQAAVPPADKVAAALREVFADVLADVIEWDLGSGSAFDKVAAVQQIKGDGEPGDDDDQTRELGASSATEIAKTLLFAFKAVTDGPSSVSFVSHDLDATLYLNNVPLLAVLPKSKDDIVALSDAACHEYRSGRTEMDVFDADYSDDTDAQQACEPEAPTEMAREGTEATVDHDDSSAPPSSAGSSAD